LILPKQAKKIIGEEGKKGGQHAEIIFKRQTSLHKKQICASRALMDQLNAEIGASGQF